MWEVKPIPVAVPDLTISAAQAFRSRFRSPPADLQAAPSKDQELPDPAPQALLLT